MENSIPVLPEELVTEILSRLPVKSLLKFACVSKSWLALISSPEFVKTHLSLNANNNEYTRHKVMMFERTAYTFRDCSVSSLFNNSSIRANNLDYPRQVPCCFYMVGSVNGLICLVSQLKEFFLWNPSIRKYKKLSDRKTKTNFVYSVYGFGYDEFHDDYKVVVIFIIGRDDFSLQIEVKEYMAVRFAVFLAEDVMVLHYLILNSSIILATYATASTYSGALNSDFNFQQREQLLNISSHRQGLTQNSTVSGMFQNGDGKWPRG
ncbi:F-box/kelch-repeat protein At3g23880-like [Solanum stenotomum]|uniref:F-box/kelch-repeat protein At3g23880-like n=1 Tax=Solanum stenotomum TaxID=172797 RepID=UPI0020D02242|nr:F-box/kelch-repeat protein At3g23880-like [Solanum stenotomum]